MGNSITIDNIQFFTMVAHIDGLAVNAAIDLIANTTIAALIILGANKILIQALTQNVRYTLDGSVPTATAGFQLKAGDPPVIISILGITVLKVIEETATADVQIQAGK